MANSDSVIFKCRRCRIIVLTGSSAIVTGHGQPYTDFESSHSTCSVKEADNIWYLREGYETDWIKEQVNKGEWTKGKLFCPNCECRIGTFDFVTGARCPCKLVVLPPIHFIKKKLDSQSTKKIELRRVKMDQECTPILNSLPGSDSSDMLVKIGKGDTKMQSIGVKSTNQKCSDNSTIAAAQIKLRKRIKKKDCNTIENSVSKIADRRLLQLEDGSFPSEGFDSFLCPICLDLYLCPFTCQPCGHIFCEMCLRRIAKHKPTHTNCPICRQIIGRCELNREISSQVKSLFPEEYNIRLKEGNKDSQYSPLPWNPYSRSGLKNIFSSNPSDDDHDVEQTSLWNFFSSQQRTITILLSLKILSASMFFIGYFGGASITSAVQYVASFFSLNHSALGNE